MEEEVLKAIDQAQEERHELEQVEQAEKLRERRKYIYLEIDRQRKRLGKLVPSLMDDLRFGFGPVPINHCGDMEVAHARLHLRGATFYLRAVVDRDIDILYVAMEETMEHDEQERFRAQGRFTAYCEPSAENRVLCWLGDTLAAYQNWRAEKLAELADDDDCPVDGLDTVRLRWDLTAAYERLSAQHHAIGEALSLLAETLDAVLSRIDDAR